jgi:HemY protein
LVGPDEARKNMIRVAAFLIVVALLALGVGWLADRPGAVALTWQGWQVETSIAVAIAALLVVVVVASFFWSFLRAVVRSPRDIAASWRRRRGAQGYLAISKGLIAIGVGDMRAARKHANNAGRLVPGEPLTLLLGAQSAQLSGDRAAAERIFRTMAAREDTKLLGLRGLYVEAQRRADAPAARLYAEEAAKTAPSLPWAGQAALQFRCAAGDWAGALEILDQNRKSGDFDKSVYRRQRAVLITARALALEDSNRDTARALALEAAKLAPDFVPAAALAGRFLAEAGELRKASRIIEKAWRANPHPQLAEVYAHLRFGDSARDRLARIETLAGKMPGHVESALAVARAAIDAGEFAVARAALNPFLARPTQRVALLMAELEETEHGDIGRAREWTARAINAARDPAWTADGFVSDRWLPISPVSGRLDAFEWKIPLAQIAAELPVVDDKEEIPAAKEAIVAPEPIAVEEQSKVAANVSAVSSMTAQSAKPARASRKSRGAPREAVIPIVHVPDDPGPETEAEPEPAPEPSPAPTSGWRGLFR